MSIAVFLLIIFYSIKAKGGWGFTKELFTAPFHAHGTVAQDRAGDPEPVPEPGRVPVQAGQLGMRLFGNMYAGELVFMLIAGLFAVVGAPSCFGVVVQLDLGDLPHPDHPAAGLHLHDADRRLPARWRTSSH